MDEAWIPWGTWGGRKNQAEVCTLSSLEHSCLSDQYILLQNTVIGAEMEYRGMAAMFQQPPLPSRKQSRSLVTSPYPSKAQDPTLSQSQQWAPEVNVAASVWETAHEWQMHTEANPCYIGEDTEVKQLRSGSRHYWKKAKPQTHQRLTPTPPLFTPIH